MAENALQIGDTAPDFELMADTGEEAVPGMPRVNSVLTSESAQ